MDECGNYYIEDIGGRVGRGGFGEVYKCYVYNRTKSHKKIYARKYFSPSPENNSTPIREIADLRERFLVEIKTQCKLNSLDHSAIAPIVLYNTYGEQPYFIMELAQCNLRDAIHEGMDDAEKANAIIQVLKGVKLIHDNNYYHRDLKPENVLRYSNNSYKISDFGLVKDMDALRAEVKTKFNAKGLGSDGYRAPEIQDSALFSVQSDIFALGKIISDVYAGTAPQKIKQVITTCQQFFPDDRYRSVDELLGAFQSAITLMSEVA
ncbi:protein kinase domain-containing protein [Vibrio campbellii]|uniref:protein kinase domain-containing protein n=1 Tax=Vibrio campbellii TaxID=680 RepID=UPI00330F2405|nr:protein kinase [Vibrio campbellii]